MPVEQGVTMGPLKNKQGLPLGVGVPAEPSMADEIAKLRKQKMLERIAAQEYGLNPPPAPLNPEPSLAASVVTKAMEVQTQAADRAQKMADRNDDIARQARAEADKAQKDVIALSMGEMTRVVDNLRHDMAEAAKGNKTPTFAEHLKELKEFAALMNPAGATVVKPAEVNPPHDYKVELQLQEMRHNQEMALKKIDMEIAKMNMDFGLRKAEFEDNRHRKDLEYQDSVAFRNNAVTSLGKIAQAAAGAFGGGVAAEEVADIGEGPGVAHNPGMAKEPKATVQSFPCQFCQTMIQVPPEGGVVECGKCKARFNIEV